nr:ribonuclease H-like domain-containing protein [Tanacetum cinerariifolium]
GNPQHALKDKGVIDSRCSRHMTGNMSYLSDFEELNSGYDAFGGNQRVWELSSSSGNFFWQWEHITESRKTALKVGMDRTFNSQQSSPKLDAASAIKFL